MMLAVTLAVSASVGGGSLRKRSPPSESCEAGLDSTVVVPLATKLTAGDAFPLRVRIPAGTCGLESENDVLVDQILAWDNSLFRRELGLPPEALIENVKAALKDFLDLQRAA